MRPLSSAALVLVAFHVLHAQAPAGRLISARDLAVQVKDPAVVILHVAQNESSYTQGHVPGARFLDYDLVVAGGADDIGAELPPLAQLEQLFEGVGVSDTSRVVIYGPPVLAARVFFTLDAVGHPHVAMLNGGLKGWQAEGHAVDSGPDSRPATRGGFTPRLQPERIVTADWVRAHIAKIALLDVRPDPEFTGADGGMGGAHPAGHIEGARQLPWNMVADQDGRFLPDDQLRARLNAAGATGPAPVVAYCMVGMRASVVYFVARHLGLDARLYDGSIVDWGRRGLPTKTGR